MSRSALTALLLAVPTLAMAQPALAKEVKAHTMKYSNEGAYTAQFYIRYNLDNGTNCKVRPKGLGSANIHNGGSVTYAMTDTMQIFDGNDACLQNGDIPEGLEVWGRVEISHGSNEGCKKDKKVIYKVSGGTVKYKTKGTTLNDNRCRVSSWP